MGQIQLSFHRHVRALTITFDQLCEAVDELNKVALRLPDHNGQHLRFHVLENCEQIPSWLRIGSEYERHRDEAGSSIAEESMPVETAGGNEPAGRQREGEEDPGERTPHSRLWKLWCRIRCDTVTTEGVVAERRFFRIKGFCSLYATIMECAQDPKNTPEGMVRRRPSSFVRDFKPAVVEDECSICFDQLQSTGDNANTALLPCSHAFHVHCLDAWKAACREAMTCPICRTNLGGPEERWEFVSTPDPLDIGGYLISGPCDGAT
eukprot:m.89237 g.89237  ORF g.89237 m.89237 type:complete len:264 (+) comp14968_c2_seq1:1034-1825(+)